MLKQTPSQTVGPFFSFSLIRGKENVLVDERCLGERLEIKGAVLDGDGEPVPDALVEIWQADARGIYNHPADPQYANVDKHFRGFGRSDTMAGGHFWFKTIKPGPVAGPDGQAQAPHLNMMVFARGMLIHAITRVYFSDESANQTDPVLNSIDDPQRRQTLIARREESEDLPCYHFDIHLQGEGETVFLDV
jgi:protocatechuate 3,4-dioxygenase alpha subunit